jgi:hypothetical protein
MKYIINLELTEREALTVAAAMYAAAFDDGSAHKSKGDTSGFRKLYDCIYPQLGPKDREGLDSVMSLYKEVMGKPTFTRGAMHGAMDSLKEEISEGVAKLKKRRGKK